MDDSLRIIQHLYDEDVDEPAFSRRVAEDEELRQEYERLRETKEALDRRSSPSPDPEVVDRVVARAADAARDSGPPERAPDRAARPQSREWTRRLQGAGATLAILLVVGLGWWQLRPTGADTADGESAAQQTEAVTATPERAQDRDAIPEWDDRDEVVRLHRRIERLRTQSRSDAWGSDIQSVGRSRP